MPATAGADRRKTESLLLALEAFARTGLRRAVRVVAAKQAARAGTPRDVIGGVVTAKATIALLAGQVILSTTVRAKADGAESMARELEQLGVDEARAAAARMAALGVADLSAGEVREAKRIAGNLGDLFARKTLEAQADGAAPAQAFAKAAEAVRSRVDTIAASESSARFSEARAELAAKTGGRDFLLEWSAQLDRRTCPLCDSLHGQTYPAGGDLNGYTPGAVHARCRCTSFPVT